MKNTLLQSEVQNFITESLCKNIVTLALQKNPFPELAYTDILQQIESKQRAKTKLPTWYTAPHILYPSKLSVEQTSSEVCASYKASLCSGNRLIDLTGGFGIDCYYFSKQFKEVVHCEQQPELSEIVSHNFEVLQANNITCITTDSTVYLEENQTQWDCIYVDPARRNQSKEKVFFLRDCTPNVPDLLDTYFKYTNTILLKTAPLLDITAGLTELKNVKEIHIVALDNEVKELLWILDKNYQGTIELVATNIQKSKTDTVRVPLEEEAHISYSEPLKYLYEPNAALMKTGKFNFIGQHFQLKKLQQHTQLYTSNALIDFPGRKFEITAAFPFNKQYIKSHLSTFKGNITTRNFPMKVEEIRKKWKVKDGGTHYLFLTTDLFDNKIMLFCNKIA